MGNEDEIIESIRNTWFDYDDKASSDIDCGSLLLNEYSAFIVLFITIKRSNPETDITVVLLQNLMGLRRSWQTIQRTNLFITITLLGYMVIKGTGFDNPDLDSSLLVRRAL